MLKTWLDGPLAHLVRRLAHPPAKMYIGFPNSRLDGPLACLVCRLVVPQLKLYIYCFCQMKYCYMAYQLIWQPTNALFMLKSRLDGPLACLVRRLAIPLLKLYIPFAPIYNATWHTTYTKQN